MKNNNFIHLYLLYNKTFDLTWKAKIFNLQKMENIRTHIYSFTKI